ncbi:unnamed protein product [Symbiodinium sp. CCMP2592]|nr:unnamed protein product [Symbiodinium sp. CCMP2592]
MEAAAMQLATALLSKTWSGSSMLKGVSSALETVKTELPESETELQQMIKASKGFGSELEDQMKDGAQPRAQDGPLTTDGYDILEVEDSAMKKRLQSFMDTPKKDEREHMLELLRQQQRLIARLQKSSKQMSPAKTPKTKRKPLKLFSAWHTVSVEEQPAERDEKFWNRMRSKVNRLCDRTKSGKLQVSDDIHKMWKEAGSVRDNLILLMADANGDRATRQHATMGQFIRKVDLYREQQKFREQVTEGAFYTEVDLKRKRVAGIIELCEKTPGHVRTSKYDGEKEYWYDHTTRGARGTRDTEGLRDSTSASGAVDSFEQSAKSSDPHKNWDLSQLGSCAVKDSLQRHMNEAVTARDKLLKFTERLDRDDASVQASAKHVATIAEAFATQDNDCKALRDLGGAPKSDAEKSLQKTLRKWDLTLNVPWTYQQLSEDCSVPMLMPSDYLTTLVEKGYLHKLLGSERLREFWSNYAKEEPNHELFQHDFLDFGQLDFERLYYGGLDIGNGRVLRFIPLGLKGDLPFLSKSGHLTRTFLHIRKGPAGPKSKPLTGCCWLCHAGTDQYDFEDLGSEPAWLATTGPHNPPPWDAVPPFFDHVAHVVEDKASFFTLDVLHIYHLGVGRDFGASALVVALGLYGRGSVPEALDDLNADLRRFLKSSGKSVHFRSLTRDLLGFSSETTFPVGHWSKAMDTPILVAFAAWVLQQRGGDGVLLHQVLISGSGAIELFMKTLLQASLWLDRRQATIAGRAGIQFLARYQKAAQLSYAEQASVTEDAVFANYPEVSFGDSSGDGFLSNDIAVPALSGGLRQLPCGPRKAVLCERCGCTRRFDAFGERHCWCDSCWEGCWRPRHGPCKVCGCSRAFDNYGDRICWCDSCWPGCQANDMDDCVPPTELAGCRCGRRGCPGDAWDATDMTKPIIIKESTAAGFMAFLQGLCPKARGLSLRQRRHPFALPLCALPAALPGLRQLRITADLSSFWDSSEVFGQVAGNLEELVLEDPALRSQAQIRFSGLAKLRTLRRLRLHLQPMVSYSDLLLLATGCQCLEELSLSTLEMPSGSGVLQGVSLFRKLRCFKMLRQSNAIVDASFLASVWRLCPALQTLWVLQCAGRRLCFREVLAVSQLGPGPTSLVVLPEEPYFGASRLCRRPSAKLERSIAALRQADIDLGDPCSPLFREEYTQHEWVELLRRFLRPRQVRDDTTSDGETDGEGWPNEEDFTAFDSDGSVGTFYSDFSDFSR